MIADPAAFVRANTRLQPVPHAPEISLWLADEITPIWRLTEEELGEMGLPPPFWAFAWAGGQALARWLLDNPQAVAGKRVLDLAAGSGLVGIAAMKARSHHRARVVRAARKGSTAEPSTQACSAMFLRRVTIGNHVAIGSSHSARYAHHRPTRAKAANKPALTIRNGATDRPVTRAS